MRTFSLFALAALLSTAPAGAAPILTQRSRSRARVCTSRDAPCEAADTFCAATQREHAAGAAMPTSTADAVRLLREAAALRVSQWSNEHADALRDDLRVLSQFTAHDEPLARDVRAWSFALVRLLFADAQRAGATPEDWSALRDASGDWLAHASRAAPFDQALVVRAAHARAQWELGARPEALLEFGAIARAWNPSAPRPSLSIRLRIPAPPPPVTSGLLVLLDREPRDDSGILRDAPNPDHNPPGARALSAALRGRSEQERDPAQSEALDAVAMARFYLAEHVFQELDCNAPPSTGPASQISAALYHAWMETTFEPWDRAQLQAFSAHVAPLVSQIVHTPAPRWQLAALSRMGHAVLTHASRLLSAPAYSPMEGSPVPWSCYRADDTSALPYYNRAIELLVQCAKIAQEARIDDGFSQACLRDLHTISPTRFPLHEEITATPNRVALPAFSQPELSTP